MTLLRCCGSLSARDGLHALSRAEQEYVGPALSEKSVGDHADDLVELLFQLSGHADGQAMDIENGVAATPAFPRA